ncbi:MAG: FKBP-type peptidyl-prolyl cis-trans isomerase [Candidatus Thermoplasmatota archaeon]|nr:FKBP-type peptidyl-prolyl cis-trans isomerase [Candidatus Thermoplasmatota archaeon]
MEKGDIIYVEYDAYADGKLFDTTHEDLARENEIYNENQKYSPLPVIIGAGRLVRGFEKTLVDAGVGEEKEVEFGEDEGYGTRDPRMVETFSVREFRRERIEPQPGMEVSIRNRRGTVIAATAGRVIVDFNDPLAGKTLKYKFKILEKVEEPERKVQAIIEMYYPSYEGFKISHEGEFINVVLPEICKSDQRWFLVKFAVVGDLRDYAEVNKVRFVEEYVTEEKKGEERPVEKEPEAQTVGEAETQEAETQEAETQEAETQEAETQEAETQEAETQEAETQEAETQEAETKTSGKEPGEESTQ